MYYYFVLVVIFFSYLSYRFTFSMYVSIELQRFIGSKFIEWDLEMHDEKTNISAKTNTSDLNEDLGQIEYLFSDKTGTLTENQMEFKKFSINGAIYEEAHGCIRQSISKEYFELNKVSTLTYMYYQLFSSILVS